MMIINTKIDQLSFPDASDLRYFHEIANTLNLSRASERLGVGQPTLSLSLKRLEENLETKLFFRRSRGLELTPAGEELLKECHHLLHSWQKVALNIKKSQHEIAGRFVLGCHPSVAIAYTPSILKTIYHNYPFLEVHLVHDLSRNIAEKVISGHINFGLVMNPIRHPDLVIKRVGFDEVGFWQKESADEQVLIYNPHLFQSQDLLKKANKKKQWKRSITTDNLELIAHLAIHGIGVAILPKNVASMQDHGDLKHRDDLPTYKDELCLIYRHDLIKTSAVGAFLKCF